MTCKRMISLRIASHRIVWHRAPTLQQKLCGEAFGGPTTHFREQLAGQDLSEVFPPGGFLRCCVEGVAVFVVASWG